jgi:hypothetical protein
MSRAFAFSPLAMVNGAARARSFDRESGCSAVLAASTFAGVLRTSVATV